LIAKFFDKALPEHRGEAVWQLNKRTHQNKGNWQRTKEIWIWRSKAAANANFGSDFKPEMEAFNHLLLAAPAAENIKTLWSLLEGFLPFIGDSENRSRIWGNVQKYLAREVKSSPVEAIRFYSLIHDRPSSPRFYYENEAKEIIITGMEYIFTAPRD
jgi:hypothetical protein